jgi:hypothetical protein
MFEFVSQVYQPKIVNVFVANGTKIISIIKSHPLPYKHV